MSLNESLFYSRLNDSGEYKYNNRLDTLFVLQLTFIIILIYVGLYYLTIYGLFSRASLYIVSTLLIVVLLLIIINRAIVMPKMRSKFIWDRYNFGDGTNKPTATTYVEGGVDGGQSGASPSSTCRTETVCTQNVQI